MDLVIVAGDSSAIAAAIEAARSGMRVLVVVGSTRIPLIRPLHRALRAAGARVQRSVTVFTNAEVVCVDGIDRVEAVVVRRIGTGRLIGVNAAAIHVLGAENESSSVRDNRQGRNDALESRAGGRRERLAGGASSQRPVSSPAAPAGRGNRGRRAGRGRREPSSHSGAECVTPGDGPV